MTYLIERRVVQTFVFVDEGKYYRVEEVLDFDFDNKKYKLTDFTIEEVAQLKGGDK